MKINFDTSKIKSFTKGTVKIIGFIIGELLLLTPVHKYTININNSDDNSNASKYYDVIKTISDSYMWDGDKQTLIGMIPKNESDSYYDAVIHILESCDWGETKIECIKNITRK